MRSTLLIPSVLLAATLVMGTAATRYVATNSIPEYPFVSWATAAGSIQQAVRAADPGDLILVHDGVYARGTTEVFTNQLHRVALTFPVEVRSVNGPDRTVIWGKGGPGWEAVRGVYLCEGATLSGFTVEGGATWQMGNLPELSFLGSGGGVLLDGGGVVTNCVLRGNTGFYGGGGAALNGGGLLVDCLLIDNETVHHCGGGGGIFFFQGGVATNCVVTGNETHEGTDVIVGQLGGGVFFWEGGNLLSCTVTNNRARADGGGLYFQGGGVARDCRVGDNLAGNHGGGVRMSHGGLLAESEVVENYARFTGGGVELQGESVVSNCVVRANTTGSQGGGLMFFYGGEAVGCTLIGNQVTNDNPSINYSEGGGGAYLREGGVLRLSSLVDNSTRYNAGGAGVTGAGLISRCVITNNSTSSAGGGVVIADGGRVERTFLLNNDAGTNGGGFMLVSEGGLENCVVSGNRAGESGGGGYFFDADKAGLWTSHCTIVANWAGGKGGGVHFKYGGMLQNSIVYGNEAGEPDHSNWYEFSTDPGIRYTCSIPLIGERYGVGNITNAPVFLDAENGVFHLATRSPGVDAAATNVLSVDMVGVARPLDGDGDGLSLPDCGAFEAIHPLVDSDHDGMPDLWEADLGQNPALDDAVTDLDGDGMQALAEFLAGTDPGSAVSCLRVDCESSSPGPSPLRWWGVNGRVYTVLQTSSLGPSAAWSRVPDASDLIGTGTELSWAPTLLDPESYYRVEVRLAEPGP